MITNKSMIDLVREIRRHCKPNEKPIIKLANPNVLDDILVLFHKTDNVIFRALVKELCLIAGSPWFEALNKTNNNTESQNIIENPETIEQDQDNFTKSIKMYRGVRIR